MENQIVFGDGESRGLLVFIIDVYHNSICKCNHTQNVNKKEKYRLQIEEPE